MVRYHSEHRFERAGFDNRWVGFVKIDAILLLKAPNYLPGFEKLRSIGLSFDLVDPFPTKHYIARALN